MSQRSYKAWRSVAIVSACICVFCLARFAFPSKSLSAEGYSSADGKTLIVHIFADTDPEYLENLKFFVQWGISPEDQADFVVVVQSTEASIVGLPSFLLLGVGLLLQDLGPKNNTEPFFAAGQATNTSSKCKVCATQK